jgi:hypothetical protein
MNDLPQTLIEAVRYFAAEVHRCDEGAGQASGEAETATEKMSPGHGRFAPLGMF